jgi:hypothetical protein
MTNMINSLLQDVAQTWGRVTNVSGLYRPNFLLIPEFFIELGQTVENSYVLKLITFLNCKILIFNPIGNTILVVLQMVDMTDIFGWLIKFYEKIFFLQD